MKAAVFGTGIVGQVISEKLTSLGHSVMLGTRDPEKTMSRPGKDQMGNPPFGEWFAKHKQTIKLGTFSEAASASEIIFNCTSGIASVQALQLGEANNLQGKIIVDIANPLDFSKGMPPGLNPVNTDSLGELIQRTFPESKVVKTLNTMTCFVMVNPASVPGDHNVFLSGNDNSAKQIVKDLLTSFGWKTENMIDLGDITTSRGTEQVLPIWIRLMSTLKTPMFNFKIVK
jgi:predicted dinucleotide-binding enzyme